MKKYNLSFNDQIYGLFEQPLSSLVFELDRKVDKQILEEAVNKTLHYHPIFKTEIVVQGGLMHLHENPLPVKVRDFSWEKGYRFKKEDNNNYSWIIACSENIIFFTGSHITTDGCGLDNFFQTLLRFYLEMTGEKFEGDFGLTSEEDIIKSAADPFELLAVPGMADPLPKHAKARPINVVPEELYETDASKLTIKQFIFDENEIRAKAKETETSTFAVISVILAEALSETIGAKDGYVQVRIPSNFRVKTELYTDRCFLHTAYLSYDIARAAGKPLGFAATGFRSQMDIEMDRDVALYRITDINEKTKMVNENPDMLKQIIGPITDQVFNNEAKVMYTHVNRHAIDDEILKHVRNLQILAGEIVNIDDPVLSLNCAIGSSFNNKIYICLYHKIRDGLWEANIEKSLKRHGISYEITDARRVPIILYDYGMPEK